MKIPDHLISVVAVSTGPLGTSYPQMLREHCAAAGQHLKQPPHQSEIKIPSRRLAALRHIGGGQARPSLAHSLFSELGCGLQGTSELLVPVSFLASCGVLTGCRWYD